MGSCLLSCISILRVMRLRFICLRQTVSKIKTAITVNPAGTRGKRARLNAKGTVNIPKTETRETANRSSPKAEFSGLSLYGTVPEILPAGQCFLKEDGLVVPAAQLSS